MTDRLEVHPATPERWADVVELFERKGPRGGWRNSPGYGCWCMYWRDRSLGHGTPKKRALGGLVRAGWEPGLLAYDDGSPVGWVAVAPREDYGALLRSPQYQPRDDDAGVWSIVCFLVDRASRRAGVAAALLEGAIGFVRAKGAAQLEAYGSTTHADDYMGSRDLFLAHGFGPLREAPKRTIVRLELA